MSFESPEVQLALARNLEQRMGTQLGQGADLRLRAGPPNWDRSAWDAFHQQHGFYPFGLDGAGGMVTPPHYDGAPDWVFVLMDIPKGRVPPIRMRPPQ
jgi:hypothetical protein